MPTPTLKQLLLNKLGLGQDAPPLNATTDAVAQQQQSQLPTGKQYLIKGIDKAGDLISGVMNGLVGNNFTPGAPTLQDKSNAITQMLTGAAGLKTAGMPFAAYKAAGKVNLLTHGTPNVFEKFDYAKNDLGDVLGWMVHAAENDPEYSAYYALQQIKPHNPHPDLYDKNYQAALENYNRGANIIPIEPEANNVLDLVEPKEDDMSAALAAMIPDRRKMALSKFKQIKRISYNSDNPSILPWFDDRKIQGVLPANPATTYLAHNLRMGPEEFARSPFDAIRYHDMDKRSWAIPPGTPIKTKWGASLTDDPQSLQVIRNDTPSGGQLQINPTPNKYESNSIDPSSSDSNLDILIKAIIGSSK